jgi:hypothetical protein
MSSSVLTPVQALAGAPGRSSLQANTILLELAADGLTAKASGNQTNGTQVTTQVARFSTVATAGDSCLLPEARPGAVIVIINDGAAVLGVYGQGTDTIDQATNAAGVSQMANSVARYVCTVAGAWRSQSLAVGYDPILGLQTLAAVDGLAANSAANQANGTAINKSLSRFSTVGGAGYSALLPASAAGLSLLVLNTSAANNMAVYPAANEQINGGGNNNAFTIPPASLAWFYCTAGGNWYASPSYQPTSAGLQLLPVAAALTANSNNNNTAGTPLTGMINQVSTVGGNNYSVLLPASAAGLQIVVTNASATNNFYVYSKGADTIGAGNNSLVGAGNTSIFVCPVAGNWYAK